MPFNRRDFLMLASAAAPIVAAAGQAQAQTAAPAVGADVAWLDGAAPATHEGQTWGLPWPMGAQKKGATFALTGANAGVPLQSWPIAWWPDGSIKWTAHSVPANARLSGEIRVGRGTSPAPQAPVRVTQGAAAVEVASGDHRWRIPRSGRDIIASASVGGRETLRAVRLVAMAQDKPDLDSGPVASAAFESRVDKVTVEQEGPVRAVIKVEGMHSGAGRAWLPFSLRLYFHAGSQAVKVMHSFIFDGDEKKDFIRGLGLTGAVPMTDLMYDRHVRFAGEADGVWAEAVRTLTGLRREPGAAFRRAQIAGEKVPPAEGMNRQVSGSLDLIPAWGDFTLSQPNADGFTIRKRTKAGHGWIDVVGGSRATGLGYIGGAAGGVAFAMNDFWKRPPTALDIRDAHTDAAQFTVWFWSPDAPAMDIRFYHDGMGMVDHEDENRGLEITYEDYEKGDWGRPYGIARTNAVTLWALPATPPNARLADIAATVRTPPRLVATPPRLLAARVLGDWSLPDRSTPTRARIEDQNDYLLKFYMDQVEQRRWYGFWNHGDVMHSYDGDRHVWKYDVGGFAWANSELSPDLWLWYSFLRSGRADVFRLAEDMTRHTGEVDVQHIGPYKGFGTRHGVQHWSDSSKQPRVSNAAYRRIYYYLTADERVGDLMRDLIGSDETFTRVDITRKRRGPGPNLPAGTYDVGFGTSWSSLAAAWLTEWERTGDTRWRDRIIAGMDTIAALQKQWFAGGAPYDLRTGRFQGPGDRVSVSHLNAVFGAVETHSELFQIIEHPAYKKAWLDYCIYYNASNEEFQAKTGGTAGNRSLRQGHSRLTAYAANQLNDPKLAERAWLEFAEGPESLNMAARNVRLSGPQVFAPVDENTRVSTNGASQWGLAAIQNLALIGDALETAMAKAPPARQRPAAPAAQ